MRTSTMIVLAILVVGFGTLLILGGSLAESLKADVLLSQELTRLFLDRGDVAEGSAVKTRRVQGGSGRLAPDGHGVLVEVTPSPAVRARPQGLRGLAMLVARAVREERGTGSPPDWVEIALVLGPAPEGIVRTLVRADPDGGFLEPSPAPPASVPVAQR